ncbi:Enoyl-CoA hydratase [Vibrio cincinnatiensis]|uniref:Enoyl-CoA hydratase n=1 Tax=Vibrio cincinnatiensis DSM 19608 TaxID=1123491 RepID=A0A1T4RVV9_VIBCI|nr:enoyl-CoA hydratase-related protein [Vibrio cincinnatiensis]SKA20006.1 enoyl-CoA hydratase [Vibrio cincinnatiensis DSM 19608]SUP49034.1 Enoyl-CoA hydratase [Vibrio cincinnatiensis]
MTWLTGYPDLICDMRSEGVLIITLDRPQKRNTLSNDVLAQIVTVLNGASEHESVKAVVIYGGKRLFAAGADLNELAEQKSIATWLNSRPKLWQHIDQFDKPLIAAVNGYALGAGLELALLCDITVAGDGTLFGLPEITLGLMPGAGGTQRLARTVGKSLANQMVFTGQAISAQKALDAGLISEITIPENTLNKACELASLIAQRAPLALRAAKMALKAVPNGSLSQGLMMERQLFSLLAETQDREEGILAFLDKRKAVFEGK